MRKIILDTNFLLIPAQFKVDIFSEIKRISDFPYQLCVVDKTINELNKLEELGSKTEKINARIALKLVKQKDLKILPSSHKYADKAIEELSSKDDAVATQDKELKQSLKGKNIKIITLKQRKYLDWG